MKKRILPLLFSALLMLTACGGAASGLILDVREQDEYDGGHIPGAVLLPLGSISEESAARVIPEKDTTVLVYCRSGSRSKKAAKALAELGYTGIYEFGGIRTWTYGIES